MEKYLAYYLTGFFVLGVSYAAYFVLKMAFSVFKAWVGDTVSRFWPEVEGTVIIAYINESDDGEDIHYSPFLEYKYRVRGKEFVSNRISFWEWSTMERWEIRHLLRTITNKSPFKVRYNPFSPKSSVVSTGVGYQHLEGLSLLANLSWFLLPFFIKLGFVVVGVWALLKSKLLGLG